MKLDDFTVYNKFSKMLEESNTNATLTISKEDLSILIKALDTAEKFKYEIEKRNELLESCIITVEAIFGGEILMRIH